MNSMKRQKDRTLKDELPRLVGAQYATGDQWRNDSRKNEETEAKQKQHRVVDVTGDGILVELFQILKDDAVKVLHSIYQHFGKLRSGHKTAKVSFHSNPKEK